ncbi:DJ-1 family glyoxalase III [Miniphocaeibacter halophilus]|uniref:DJ-1/PfpI family protein n=1 Tax=Miniphocaeibacter halophilus TaxID=2931922 RepID=A0AC61MQK1_9FIRM|nr:DJ-1 family glyoxalase III [Miniphocaeibacter halophilus]QQK07955.1 DJ-1/PfpI family protein [Miniphocaeibacter halophilus]
MSKVIILLADGIEEVEALTQVDYLRRVGIEVDMVSVSDSLTITGAHNIVFQAEKFLKDIDFEEYDGIIIPGGLEGVENLMADARVLETVKNMHLARKMIAAICAGPLVLNKAGILDERRYTCYTGIENRILNGRHRNEAVVIDDNIITAAGPAYAQKFAFNIVKDLLGRNAVKELKKDILYKRY